MIWGSAPLPNQRALLSSIFPLPSLRSTVRSTPSVFGEDGGAHLGHAREVLPGTPEPLRLGEGDLAQAVSVLPLVRIGDGGAVDLADSFAHPFLEVGEVLFVNAAGVGIELLADACRHPDNFALGAAGAHHPHRPERFVGNADASPGHEEVVDVPGIEATVGNPEGTVILEGRKVPVFGVCDEGISLEALVVAGAGEVEIVVPAGGSASVGEFPILH